MKIRLYVTFGISLLILTLASCNDKNDSSVPQFLFGSVILASEDDPDGSISIPVYLSQDYSKTVSVDFETVDSTAVAGRDYVGINSGNLTFQPGELAKEIQITIIPDTNVRKEVLFKIKFSNPVNGEVVKSVIRVIIINVDYKTLVWVENFDAATLNSAIWNYNTGGGGWGNNELQTYTTSTENVHIDSGYLHITALNPSGSTYTSGRITTQGKQEFKYFRADIKAKLPEGQGLWPALWMLGANFSSVGWPKCGEIDIMELLGHQPSISHGAIHWGSYGHVSRTSSFTLNNGKFSSGFHIFSLIWTPYKMIWLVDNQQFFFLTRSEIPEFPFDFAQFFILNVAVGGNWPGPPNATTVFPQHMIVDYIKVYQ